MKNTILTFLILSTLAGCGESEGITEITETRTERPRLESTSPNMTDAQRFGYAASGDGAALLSGGAHDSCPHTEQGIRGACCPDEEGTSSTEPRTSFETRNVPSGWTQGADRPMRLVTFTIGEQEATECYIVVLAGSGGGSHANVNRWRKQMGQSPLTPEEVEGLPTIHMLGRQAKLAEVKGEFTGMDGAVQPKSMMLGAICALPAQTLFVKMLGPEAEVVAEKENFVSFCESLVAENARA